MTAITPGREELLALADNMAVALKKHRSADSPEIMVRAHASLGLLFYGHIQLIIDALRLAAKPADEGINQQISYWKNAADNADTKMAALTAFGVYAGLSMAARGRGTTACPICGKDTPHHHALWERNPAALSPSGEPKR